MSEFKETQEANQIQESQDEVEDSSEKESMDNLINGNDNADKTVSAIGEETGNTQEDIMDSKSALQIQPDTSSVEEDGADSSKVEQKQLEEDAQKETGPKLKVSNRRKPSKIDDMNWYVVHTYSGYEHKAKLALEERIVAKGYEEDFGEVIVPEENVVELVKGQKRTTKRRFFPGYILVQMRLTNETWHIVKNTSRITGFVGNQVNPVPVPEYEVEKMTNRIAEGEAKPRPKVSFREGEKVRVVDGPFSNFNGVVEDVNMDKGKVKVLVSIFGRATPVELDFIQVEKV